jgi:NhaP-type Na+/H+ or K+/H+ antiporter
MRRYKQVLYCLGLDRPLTVRFSTDSWNRTTLLVDTTERWPLVVLFICGRCCHRRPFPSVARIVLHKMASGDADGSSSEATISAYFVFFSTLLALVLILSKLLHDRQRLASILPEAGMILLVGITAGSLVHWLFGDERLEKARGMEMEQQQDDEYGNVNVHTLVHNVLSFSPNAFFVALLPPIIFNSGYHLRRELFFRHIQPIALLAVVGTIVSTLVVATLLQMVKLMGWIGNNNSNNNNNHAEGGEDEETFSPTLTELLAFGALLSTTDTVSALAVFQAKRVDPQLFYLVFGESVLNDAVGLVLFETFCKFVQRDNGAGQIAMGMMELVVGFALNAVASPLLGWICALLAALLFKYIDMRDHALLELALYLLIMYVPFLLAECLQISGIVTILVTGIAARHYVEPNLSTVTQDVADVIFRLAAHLAETSIFLELGLSVVGVTEFLQWKFIAWSLLACLIARACHVYPIAFLFNQSLLRKEESRRDTCRVLGYSIQDGMDGIMKMDFVQEEPNNSNSNNNKNGDNNRSTKPTVRKHMSGNLELNEHLNDFSNHHPQRPLSDHNNNNNHNKGFSEGSQQGIQTSESNTTEATLTPIPKRDLKIQPKTAHMLWFSGLRGAMAYACVRSFPDTFHHEREFTSTTMMIVLVTVFVLGGATEAVLQLLNVEMNIDEDQYMDAWRQSDQAPKPGFWTFLDERLIQRWVIRDYEVPSVDPLSSKLSTASSAAPSANAQRWESASSSIAPVASSNSESAAERRVIQNHVSSSHHEQQPDIDLTESMQYDTLYDTDVARSQCSSRRRPSLFDYGLKKMD